jgi:hypothetical protein
VHAVLGRRRFLQIAGGASVALVGAPAVLRAQTKGKVELAYLQLGCPLAPPACAN